MTENSETRRKKPELTRIEATSERVAGPKMCGGVECDGLVHGGHQELEYSDQIEKGLHQCAAS